MQYRFFEVTVYVRAHMRGALRRSTVIVNHSKGLPASCITFLSKKRPLVNQKIQEPSDRERFLQEDSTGEPERVAKDERTPLFSE